MQERQGQIPRGTEFRGQWPQPESRRGVAVLNVPSLVLFEGWGNTFFVLCHTLSDFQWLPLLAGRTGSLAGNARASPGGCPPSGPAHSHPLRALQADQEPPRGCLSCAFFLMWKIIRQQGQLGSWIIFSNLCERLYFNLKELIQNNCHPSVALFTALF